MFPGVKCLLLRKQSLKRHPNQPAGIRGATPRIWSLTGLPPINIASQCFLACCQKVILLHCSWCKTVFSSLLLERPVTGGIRLRVCTWWLHGLDRTQPADIWAAVILGNVGRTKFSGGGEWKGRSSTVPTFMWPDEPDAITKLQLAHNSKRWEFTLVE